MIPWRQYQNRTITSDTILCLDIEVSSFWIHNNNLIRWDKNLSDEFYNSECDKGSCVYIWMFGIEDTIYYGREWNEFPEFLAMVKDDAELKNEKEKLYIYIHNLSYEFQFLLNFGWKWENVFARQMRKPMKADFDIFQFRCSYMLTNLSLESWGKQLKVQKLKGQLDYLCIRSPKTPLFDYELEYCEEDIHVMLVGLAKYREKYQHIKSIPLTATGEVRKVVRRMYHKDVGHLKKTTKMLPRWADDYKISKSVFGGGDTHANVLNVNKVKYDAYGRDECSAYPFFMCVGSYPYSKFTKTIERNNFDFDKFCYIFLLHISDLKLKYKISYLARSRCISVKNGSYDNGRIVNADEVYLYCTEYDLKYIKYFYDGLYEYVEVRKAIKGHLDKKYINYILDLFNDKTTLKGVRGMEDLYQQQKAYLNSLYGMMVTDIVMPVINFKNNEWSAVGQLGIDIQASLDNLQEKWYKNILSYNHGIYVTSQARAGLWSAITAMIDAGGEEDILYYDTDSLKMTNEEKYTHVWDMLNKERMQMIKEAAKRYNIPIKRFMPIKPDGKPSILGQWDDDGHYKKFKTLGAKKYLYEDEKGLHLTVSGVPKSAVRCIKSFDDFKDGFIFDSDTCRKGLATYLDGNNWSGSFIDGYFLDQPYGLNLRNIGYTLGLTDEFKAYIQLIEDWGNL